MDLRHLVNTNARGKETHTAILSYNLDFKIFSVAQVTAPRVPSSVATCLSRTERSDRFESTCFETANKLSILLLSDSYYYHCYH